MKGLAVVALGAILIWFGLSSGGSDVDAHDGESAAVDSAGEDRSYPDVSASFVIGAQEPISDMPTAYDDPLPQGEPEAWEAADAGGTSAYADEAVQDPIPVEPEVIEAPVVTFSEPAGSPRPAYDDDLSFTGAATGDSIRLATILLEAWIDDQGSDLLMYMKEGEGADLPASHQQLIAAFWEALIDKVAEANKRLPAIRQGNSVSNTQLALLSAAFDAPGQRALPAASTSGRVAPLELSMRMVLLEDEARTLLRSRDYGRSAVAWSDLIQHEINAPWAPHRAALVEWGAELGKAQRNHRFSQRGQWPAEEIIVQQGDSLTAVRKRMLRRKPEMLICTGLIREVNNVGKYVHSGDLLRIPTDRANAIVDLDARLVLYRHGDEVVQMWECGVGMQGSETPLGVFTIGDKIEKPAHSVWGLPYGHPENPLGSRWMDLLQDGRKTSYGLHGTSDPDGVGGAVSAGCVRLRNADVNALFEILPMGSEVVIQQ